MPRRTNAKFRKSQLADSEQYSSLDFPWGNAVEGEVGQRAQQGLWCCSLPVHGKKGRVSMSLASFYPCLFSVNLMPLSLYT